MCSKVVQGFYESLRKTFFFLRLLGVFPITGLLNGNSKLSRCSWMTPYTLYFMISITSIIGCCLIHLWDVIISTRRFKEYGGLMLHCIVSLALIFIVKLSFNWRNMMDKIEGLEKLLPPFKNGRLVVKTINRVMFYVAVFTLVDHVLYLVFTVHVLQLCIASKPLKEELTVEKYYSFFFGWYLDVVPYNFVTASWLWIMRTQAAFIFSYVDALVIAVTLYLIFRFRNFNRLMRQKMKKCNQNTKWCDIQAHYTRLTRLVQVIDDNINPFVFLSFLATLLFTCKMIYDFIQHQKNIFSRNLNNEYCRIDNSKSIMTVIHYLIGVTYRLFKTLSVSILTSHLHSLSREPLEALHTLPASAYNLQFQQFMDQVYYTKICLSGLQFFYVTRGTLLSMVSTIITYELVLLQLPVIYY